MDGKNSKESEPGKQPPDIPSELNKNVPIGLLRRELGHKQKQRAVPLEFQAAAEDKLVTKDYEELRCELPGASRSTFLMVFSPDGKKVASTHGNHNVYVTDLTTGKNVNTLSGHPRTPWCIAFHPSSNQILASGCLGGQVRVWDLHGGSEVWTADGQTVIASLAFHPTDRLLVIATYNELHFWDWSQPEPFAKCYTNNEKEKVRYVAFDQLGHKLITGISNAPLVQTQWDRVTSAAPTNMNNTPTSQTSSGQNNPHHVNAPERERRITICYRSLVEQYEQLVQRYFDLSRSRSIPTMDRGTDPMDLEAETSSSSTQTGPGPSRQREMGTSTGDVASTSSANTNNTTNTNLRDVPPFDFARARAIVERMNVQENSPVANNETDQGTDGSMINSLNLDPIQAIAAEAAAEAAAAHAENIARERTRSAFAESISYNSAGTINIRTQSTGGHPGVTLNIPVVENNRITNTFNMLNTESNEMHTVIITDTSREEAQQRGESGATRDVGVGPPGEARLRVQIRTYDMNPPANNPRFSYLRTNLANQNFQASSPNQPHHIQDNSPSTEGPPWQQQACLFSRLHQQAQPTSPSLSTSDRPRRLIVSQRSAFQPRTPRTDQDGEPNERRYFISGLSGSSNPPAEPVDHPESDSERFGSISPPIPSQRSRMDMTDVGVRYGIQLLSRHIDNMQRLCRARLEILQLQQIRRMWEDLQRQIRSLHVAVRESSIALTGTSDPSATADLQRPFEGSSTPGAEQIDGTNDGNASHIPSVSQMMESARISDGSPRPDRTSDQASGSIPSSRRRGIPSIFVKNLLHIQEQDVVNDPPGPQRDSDNNVVNRTAEESNDGSGGEQAVGNSHSKPTAGSSSQVTLEIDKRPVVGTLQPCNNKNSSTCTVRILNVPQRMKILSGIELRRRCHPGGYSSSDGASSSQKDQSSLANAKLGQQSGAQSSVASTSCTETGAPVNLSRTNASEQDSNRTSETVESRRDNSAASQSSGSGGRVRHSGDSGRPRTGFWLVSTMSSVSPSSSGNSTTTTAGSSAVTVPSSTSQGNPSSNPSSSNPRHQMLQQRLLRISRKVYLRRPRLLALAPRSYRRQSGGSHLNPSRPHQGFFRHSEGGRRPWFMQSVMRSQRRSTNTASQVGSINSSDGGESSSPQAASQEVIPTETQESGTCSPRENPNQKPNLGDTSSGPASSSQDSAQPGPSDEGNSSGTTETKEETNTSTPLEESPPANAAALEGDESSIRQQEISTSESLRSMIVRLERLVQQQREHREQVHNERPPRESQGPSRRPNVWELRDGSSTSWLHNYNNVSGSDSDSSPETDIPQYLRQYDAEVRLPSSLQNEMYGENEQDRRNSSSGSQRGQSNPMHLDWEWTRESTRLRARQVLSLMVESLTQFFEENGLSHNTPHAVLDEQIYNLYVLLQLALELTDLLLAQLVSTRRELEHQWVHRLRGPVALDATLAGDRSTTSDRTRDREQRTRGRQYCGGMMYRRYHRHRVHGEPERSDRDRSSDRGPSRGRGECGRRLSSRMMNCVAKHNQNFSQHSNGSGSSSSGGGSGINNNGSGSGNSQPPLNPLGMHTVRPSPAARGGDPPSSDRPPGRTIPIHSMIPELYSPRGGILVRVQQFETMTTTTPARNTRPGSVSGANYNPPQQQQSQQQPQQQQEQQRPQSQQQEQQRPQSQQPQQQPQQPQQQQQAQQRPHAQQRLQPQQQRPQSQQPLHRLQPQQQRPQQQPQRPQQPQETFTVPLVRVNDILIPDTAMLNHQPWTRPRSPPPRPNSPFRNPFALNVPHEHRMLGAWHELFPYGPGNWRPRFLHPRYMSHSVYGEEQEDVYHGHPGENFNFIRGNSIVPDTVIITDAPMSPNHRIQVWDFSNFNIPDISNAEKNMIVPECKIHNDASVDVSRDGRLLVTLLPSGRLSITTKLGVYSLQWESLGQCLYTTSFDQSAVSVSLSPASRHLLVGLATRRVALLPSDRHTMAQIFRLEGARLGQGKDGRGRNNGTRGRLCHLRDIEQGREQGYMSLNCIRWAPGPGQGFVYGTNTGQLKVLR